MGSLRNLREFVGREQEERRALFISGLTKLQREFNCDLVPRMIATPAGMTFEIVVQPRPLSDEEIERWMTEESSTELVKAGT